MPMNDDISDWGEDDGPMNSDMNFDAEWGEDPILDSLDDVEEAEESDEELNATPDKKAVIAKEKSLFSDLGEDERPSVPIGRSNKKRSKTIGRKSSFKVVSKEEFLKIKTKPKTEL